MGEGEGRIQEKRKSALRAETCEGGRNTGTDHADTEEEKGVVQSFRGGEKGEVAKSLMIFRGERGEGKRGVRLRRSFRSGTKGRGRLASSLFCERGGGGRVDQKKGHRRRGKKKGKGKRGEEFRRCAIARERGKKKEALLFP